MTMYIRVFVTSGAKRDVIIQEGADSFRVSVRVPRERNLANTRVRELVAEHFGTILGRVRIVNGHHRPGKIISVELDY